MNLKLLTMMMMMMMMLLATLEALQSTVHTGWSRVMSVGGQSFGLVTSVASRLACLLGFLANNEYEICPN